MQGLRCLAARVGRRMQALLHGIMGLIGVGHLEVRERWRRRKYKEEETEVERHGGRECYERGGHEWEGEGKAQ